jgi:hypothetical protein
MRNLRPDDFIWPMMFALLLSAALMQHFQADKVRASEPRNYRVYVACESERPVQ